MTARTFIVSLDYELFFGPKAGSVEKCLIDPTDALAQAAENSGFRLTLFVDSGYLQTAQTQAAANASVRAERDLVRAQLDRLAKKGHDIQLHIHPHWEDTHYANGQWAMNTARYRLHDFSESDIDRIVESYKSQLEDIANEEILAYRAGGWCMQPFEKISGALKKAGVWLDSTVYAGGYSEVTGREYDFRAAPDKSDIWRFSKDPAKPDPSGYFAEVPISAARYGPATFWKVALNKIRKQTDASPFGDGMTMPQSRAYYARRLLLPGTWSPVSIDGIKAGFLPSAYRSFDRRDGGAIFNVMGHPKSVTKKGISALSRFAIDHAATLEPATLTDVARDLRSATSQSM